MCRETRRDLCTNQGSECHAGQVAPERSALVQFETVPADEDECPGRRAG